MKRADAEQHKKCRGGPQVWRRRQRAWTLGRARGMRARKHIQRGPRARDEHACKTPPAAPTTQNTAVPGNCRCGARRLRQRVSTLEAMQGFSARIQALRRRGNAEWYSRIPICARTGAEHPNWSGRGSHSRLPSSSAPERTILADHSRGSSPPNGLPFSCRNLDLLAALRPMAYYVAHSVRTGRHTTQFVHLLL